MTALFDSFGPAWRPLVQLASGYGAAAVATVAAGTLGCASTGLAVLVGAPNIVLGGSHSGNIAAIDLVRAGNAEILSSDNVPASLLDGIFKLPQSGAGISLPQAVRFASFNPARAVGFDDRGEIAPDRRADLVRVRVIDDAPIVRSVWREGERVV